MQFAILETLVTINAIRKADPNALLSSCIEHKGQVGDSDAAYIALVSRLLSLVPVAE